MQIGGVGRLHRAGESHAAAFRRQLLCAECAQLVRQQRLEAARADGKEPFRLLVHAGRNAAIATGERYALLKSGAASLARAGESKEATMQPSVFTRIIRGELPAAKVYEDEHTIAFMDAGQVNPGHVIVATRRQVETILELDDELAGALFRTAARVARAVDAAFHPEGITVLQANKPAGWQTVPHVHLHVLPRYQNDGVELVWPRKEPPLEQLRELAARIRVA
jgi:histidine triad (HIT) family protein